jgi:Family of unknown function (DUF6600)
VKLRPGTSLLAPIKLKASRTDERAIMKASMRFILVGLIGMSLGVINSRADFEVSASLAIHAKADFYVPLEAHGAWIEVGTYGRCWRPAGVVVGWRPYCDGHWEWTDCGWYWVSDEPWAWACYHYGYWVYDPVYAWIWVPDIEWAPAWVEWRVGGGYIGWAPLGPPHLRVASTRPRFVFVAESHFSDPVRPSTVIVNNTTILKKTKVINNIKHTTRSFGGSGRRRVIVNEGPGVKSIQKATGRKMKTVPILEAARHSPPPPLMQRGRGAAGGKDARSVLPPEGPKATTPESIKPGEPPSEHPLGGESSGHSRGEGHGHGHRGHGEGKP